MKEEYKLIFLTLLVRLGVGTLVVYIAFSSLVPGVSEFIISLSALLVTVSGLGISLLHVGKPVRVTNTFANRGSWMSWEAIIAPPLVLAITALALFSYINPASPWLVVLRALILILSVAFIFVTGRVYHLRARPSWNTPLVVYEYFASAAVLGLLGFAFILVITGNATAHLGRVLGFVLLPLLIAEAVITYAYRSRAMSVTVTAERALGTRQNKILYTWFIAIGLVVPLALALTLALGVQPQVLVPAALGTFLLGAVWWRVIFFRSATLIKITPDIAI